jgi:hypothetical protein
VGRTAAGPAFLESNPQAAMITIGAAPGGGATLPHGAAGSTKRRRSFELMRSEGRLLHELEVHRSYGLR